MRWSGATTTRCAALDLECRRASKARSRRWRAAGACAISATSTSCARDWTQALQTYAETETFHQAFLPADHWFFDSVASRRGEVLAAQGRHAEALPLLERATASFESDMGAAAPSVLELQMALAETLVALGRAADARALMEQARGSIERELGPAHGASVRLARLRRALPAPARPG